MKDRNENNHRALLTSIAYQAMLDRGLLPDFSSEALVELNAIQGPAQASDGEAHDLRELFWVSIDNDDSRDLDQLSVAKSLDGKGARILVAIADVDALVKDDSAIMITPATIPPPSIHLPSFFPCCPKNYPLT